MDKKKYMGIASACDFESVNLDTLNFLVKSGVLVVEDYKQTYYREDNKRTWSNEDEEFEMDYMFPMFFENKVYELSETFSKELFDILREYALCALSNPHLEIEKIGLELRRIFDNNEKISFLKLKYQEVYPKCIWYTIYDEKPIYGTGVNGIETWFEYVDFELSTSPNFLQLYLKNNTKVFMNLVIKNKEIFVEDEIFELLDDWSLYYSAKVVLSWIEEKIYSLQKESKGYINRTNKILRRSLKELFSSISNYNSFIKKLKDEMVITEDLKVIVEDSDKLKLISAICFLLKETKQVKASQKDLTNAVSLEFGVDLKENTYTNHKKIFNQFYPNNIASEKHLDRLHFIK